MADTASNQSSRGVPALPLANLASTYSSAGPSSSFASADGPNALDSDPLLQLSLSPTSSSAAASSSLSPSVGVSSATATGAAAYSRTAKRATLPELFCYSHIKRPLTWRRVFLLIAYLPVGVCILWWRLCFLICSAAILYLIPTSFHLPPYFMRLWLLPFGVVVRVNGRENLTHALNSLGRKLRRQQQEQRSHLLVNGALPHNARSARLHDDVDYAADDSEFDADDDAGDDLATGHADADSPDVIHARNGVNGVHQANHSGAASTEGRVKLSAKTGLIIASNHRGAVDVFPFLATTPVNVLVDAGFYSLISSTFQKVTGLLPIDQSDMKSAKRDHLRSTICTHLATSDKPLLVFPEGWDTNGQRGLLRYNKFLFSLGLPVVPAALEWRVPFLPLVPGMLGSKLWIEVLWCLFFPCCVWTVTFLPAQMAQRHEDAGAFAHRVQSITASVLRIEPTAYSNKDALRLRAHLLKDPSSRAKYLHHPKLQQP